MSIGLMKLYPMEALQAARLDLVEASAAAGSAMAVFFSVANGVGGVAGPILGGRLGNLGDFFLLASSICAIACLFATACMLLVRRADHAEAIRPASVHGFLHQMHRDHLEDVIEHRRPSGLF